jgi:hypothetical protein
LLVAVQYKTLEHFQPDFIHYGTLKQLEQILGILQRLTGLLLNQLSLASLLVDQAGLQIRQWTLMELAMT